MLKTPTQELKLALPMARLRIRKLFKYLADFSIQLPWVMTVKFTRGARVNMASLDMEITLTRRCPRRSVSWKTSSKSTAAVNTLWPLIVKANSMCLAVTHTVNLVSPAAWIKSTPPNKFSFQDPTARSLTSRVERSTLLLLISRVTCTLGDLVSMVSSVTETRTVLTPPLKFLISNPPLRSWNVVPVTQVLSLKAVTFTWWAEVEMDN